MMGFILIAIGVVLGSGVLDEIWTLTHRSKVVGKNC
ncbi:hypothetical protein ACT3HK_15270 [Thermolongibacillus altinsuensis]